MAGTNWRPIAGFAAVSAANQMLWLTFAPITTDAARFYGVSVDAIGWLAQIFPLIYVMLALGTGRLIDVNLRPWLGAGAVLTALGGVVRVGHHSFALALAGQVLVAVGQPLVLNSVTKLAHTYLAPSRRAEGIALSSAGVFAGMVTGLGMAALFGGGGIAPMLWVQAALAVAAALFLLWTLRTPGAYAGDQARPARLRSVVRDRRMGLLLALVCAGFGAFVALTTWLQSLLEPAGVTETEAGIMLMLMVVTGALVSALVPAKLAEHRRQPAFMLAALTVSALACVLLAALASPVTGFVAVVLLGALLLPSLPLVLELAEAWLPGATATSAALIWLAGNAAGLVVAVVVQALVSHPAAGFLSVAAVLLLALPAALALSRTPMPGAGDDNAVGGTGTGRTAPA